jgi:hypothetical protein
VDLPLPLADCAQVFDAIEGDVDAAHRIMHDALSGYLEERCWHLDDLPAYTPRVVASEIVPPDLAKEWAAQRCPQGPACPALADATCPLWHDGRELHFAKVRRAAQFASPQGRFRVSVCCGIDGSKLARTDVGQLPCWRQGLHAPRQTDSRRTLTRRTADPAHLSKFFLISVRHKPQLFSPSVH